MVYMSGSKMARHASSITNRPNCGGVKKCGTANGVGFYLPGKAGGLWNRTAQRAAPFDNTKRNDCSGIVLSTTQYRFSRIY